MKNDESAVIDDVHLEQVALIRHLKQRAHVFGGVVHGPHVASRQTDL